MSQSADNLNSTKSKAASPEASRRSKKAYAERWHRSVSRREQVSNVRGYSGKSQEPAYNRPAVDDWEPRHRCVMTMDMALREMEFPSRLAGAEWTVP